MSMSHNAKRSWAFLASAAVGLSGIAATPALANQPAPTAQIVSEQAPAAASQSLQDASVDWGVKSSFRRYITGPVAGGSQELTGATSNADGSYHFTAAEGTVEADGSYHVKFTGSNVKYTGHHGVLEVTISDLELVIKDGQGSLYANISERPYNGNTTPNPPVQHDHTLIGTFDASSLKNEGGQLTLAASDATKVKLSTEATSVFAGFYQAGQELDALAFSAKLVTKQAPAPEKPADPTPEPTQPAQPAPEPTQPEQPAPEPSKPADPAPEPAQPAPEQSKPAETPAPQPSQTSETPASTPSKPSEAPSSQPAPQPSQSSEAAKPAPAQPPATDAAPRTDVPKGQGHIIESGNLTWNIRDSFLHYLNTIARGNITVEGLSKNAAGGLDFTSASGSYDESTKTGQINFAGKVHISGHHGQLNSSFENTRLVIKEGKGYLVVDAEALNMQGENRTFKDLVLAEVDLSGATLENNVLSAKNAAVTVTVEGSEAIFAGQYNDADKRAMAPLSFSAKLGSQLVENKVTDTTVKGSNTGSGSTNLGNNANAGIGGTNFGGSVNNGGGSASPSRNGSTPAAHPNGGKSGSFSSVSKNPAQPVCTPVTVTKQVPVKAANKAPAASADGKVASADLGWGVRDSFRNYIRGGIANGSWDLNGTTYSNNAFQWAKGTGSFKDGKGSISFTGSVHFTGHHGILDTTISNPRLEINGKTAVLYATVVGNDMDGKSQNYGEVALLNVDVSGLQVSGDKISISGAGTTITAEGAKAFAGFYEAGKDMAPLSFSASLSGTQPAGNTAKTQTTQTVTETVYQGQGCDSLNARGSHGRLAHTGASGVEAGVASGLASLAAGIGAVLYTRRRKSSRISERSE
ncbi:LPXTG cell wall anchor domain-containing protein [Rothia dentocariosa]|uniref:HtaA domain-containing protein n=1 Tax=Rothia dentocariosa TaxID=2047 RepID=UPI001071B19E|nr:HtaA domain-containing protein [Rothia dentocariosa]TFI33146.1 LPXTG cell wall anchor domain-containing protein [Rothia dentocariosa]